ncbi:MAG: T9SS type A sorting domain-containing protein [Flavobacteriales bacterium]|nr:T9SS type A sorting domain-containing protein [Flavobacteriales bacterium]MCB9165779.1 T9SS type A sorting domain-containing protein [Flavobacteriales bacterium]
MDSMKSRISILLSIALTGLSLCVFAQDWKPLGPNDWNWPSVGKAYYPRLAIDANNNPVIAALDYGVDGEYHVRRWDGVKWIALGSDGFFTDGAIQSNMVLDEGGNPVLAGSDPDNGDRIIVRRWNGTIWVSVGVDGFSSGGITAVKLARDVSGSFIVAYIDQSLDRHIVVKRWTGSAWEIIGDESFSDPDLSGLRLSLDPSGNPVVAYHPPPPGIHLTKIHRWTGAIWEALPPIDLGNVVVSYTDMAVDDGANPVVVLSNWMFGDRPIVKRWNGTLWETLGPAGISVGNCSGVNIEVGPDGDLILFYRDYDDGTLLRRWNGSIWELICYVDPLIGPDYATIAFNTNGDPIVACQAYGLGWRSCVQRWDGTEWLEYGERGFSTRGAYYTGLAMNAAHEIVVAYSDPSNEGRTAVQRWNDNEWEMVGQAGFSAGYSAHHDVVLDSLGRPIVAYADNVNNGISVMQWNGDSWVSIGPLGFNGVYSWGLSLGMAPGFKPVIAYKIPINIEDYYRINVVSWDGATWNNVGQFPSVWAKGRMGFALDSMGFPTIGFHHTSIGGTVVVRWDGTTWIQLPPLSSASSYSAFGDLILDADDRPIVASNGAIIQWDGTAWEMVVPYWDGVSGFVQLAMDDHNDLVLGGLDHGRATIRRWNGAYWQSVGSERFTTSFSDFQGDKWFQTDGQGRVVVAYTNGGMYAKSIEYSDQGIVIGNGVLNLGPNPSSGEELWISLGGLPVTIESVAGQLHDMSGRLISAQLLPVAHGELNTRFAIPPGLASGMYIASVYSDGSRWSSRLIVAKP